MAETKAQTGRSEAAAWVRHADLILGLGVLGLLVTLVVPLPPVILDLLLTLNITAGLLTLLLTLNVRDPAELSTFPTILLFATLFRLGLNVASTRLILSGGDAGSVIDSFGKYVVRDNLAVGLVVFLILIVIQFVVITKGAGRISEVAARFVLDAMPGKQMAIDADLNAGLIDSDDARERRAAIAAEAEFYGAMDGASKFVRGDAIAGLIITALNLLGGVAIGMMNSMTLGEAAGRYSMLTIGDGLVSQIPALFISTAAAVLTTRASGRQSLGQNLAAQFGSRPRATIVAAFVVFVLGALPGMPGLPFFLLASALLLLWNSTRGTEGPKDLLAGLDSEEKASLGLPGELGDEESEDPEERERRELAEMLEVDRLGLEIGYRLIPLVQDTGGGGILEHISQLRKRMARTDGVLLPPVRIKDDIRLEPNAYRVMVGGVEVANGSIEPDRWLAIGADGLDGNGPEIPGKVTVDPTFGLPAVWVGEKDRDEAELRGATVIDPTSVLVTHLSETIRKNFPDLLTRDDVKQMVEGAKRACPAVVEELVPDKLGLGEIQTVLRNLLREEVPLRNLPLILETLADQALRTKDPETLTEAVRGRLARSLCEQHAGPGGVIHAVTLDPAIEARLAAAVTQRTSSEAEPVGPAYLQMLVERIGDGLTEAARGGREAVLLVRSGVRRFAAELVRSSLPKTAVLSYNEVTPAASVETAGIVRMED